MRIGVVGGGASAVCVIDALAQSGHPSGDLTVFEPAAQLWCGRAYQKDAEVVLVNSPVEDMSVRHADPGYYRRWLAGQYRATGGDIPDFAPRAVFGEYLAQTAEDGMARLRGRGWRVDVVREAVTGATRAGDRILLHTDDRRYEPFDYAVLAVGGGQPNDTYGLTGAPNFLAEPYPIAETLTTIGSDDHVAVIGSGLTAVDVLLALEFQGHRGRMTLLSRLGVLPAVRQRSVAYVPKHFVPDRLHAMAGGGDRVAFSDVVKLLDRELAEAGADLDEIVDEISRVGHEEPAARLRRQLAEVSSGRMGLRVLQQAVPLCGPDLWPLLPEVVRKDVLGPFYRTLMSLCCPMPPRSARTLLRLMDSGQLEVLSGVQTVIPLAGGGFRITTEDRELTAGHVVNGVSAPAHRIPAGARRLVDSLCAQGMAVPHADGGLCVRTSNSLCNSQPGQAALGLYAIGDITGGTFFFTFGIPSLVDRSHDIVTDILARTGEHSRA